MKIPNQISILALSLFVGIHRLDAQGTTVGADKKSLAGGIAIGASAHEPKPGKASAPIPLDQIAAVAGKDYTGNGLAVTASQNGARLHCVFQRLDAQATQGGLWLTSTVDGASGKPFRVVARAVGRATEESLPSSGHVEVAEKSVRYVRPGLTEEYSVNIGGLQQDFVIDRRPAGTGTARVVLTVEGATAEAIPGGACLVLKDGGRKLVYNQINARDARGRELKATLEVPSPGRLDVVLEDAGAEYPVRIDPNFSDYNWVSLGGIQGVGGVNGQVYALTLDGSGNLYVGGLFTSVANISATNIARWNGSTWSPLGPGLSISGQSYGFVDALAVATNGTLYAGGLFTSAGATSANSIASWNGTTWSALGSGIQYSAQNSNVAALAVSGSTLYVGGYFTTAGGITCGNIAQWNTAAEIWSNPFGAGLNGIGVYALAVSGGTLYVGGDFTTAGTITANNVAAWNISSPGWSALISGGNGVNGPVQALAANATTLYVGGSFGAAGTTPASDVASWNISSPGWSALGSGVNRAVYALALSGATLYAGGDFSTAGGSAASCVAQWNGSSWSSVVGGANGSVYALLESPGGTLYAGGRFTGVGGSGAVPADNIAQWNNPFWSALVPGTFNTVYAVAQAPCGLPTDGSIFVACEYTTAGGETTNGVAQWNPRFNTWSTLGSGMNSQVYAVAVVGNFLYAGGFFTTADAAPANYIALWDLNRGAPQHWSALGSGVNNGMSGPVFAMAASDTTLYVGGEFSTMPGGGPANNIAKFNGSWSALGSGVGNEVNALALAPNGTLYAGGLFTDVGNYIAQWNGSTWSSVGTGADNGVNGTVNALAIGPDGYSLYAGGAFTAAGGDSSARYLAVWKGGPAWTDLGSQMNNTVNSLAVSWGGTLYVGGQFTTMPDGSSANYIAQWNAGTWSTLGSGCGSMVWAITPWANGSILAGGQFTTAGGVAASGFAQWNGSQWSDPGFGLNDQVNALLMSGDILYAGGNFTTAAGAPVNYIAQWNGNSWSGLGSPGNYGMNGPVNALAMSGTTLYAGGNFTTAGGNAADYIASWNTSSPGWSALSTGVNGAVNALAANSTTLYVGGNFSLADGSTVNNIAKWNISSPGWSPLGTGVNGTVYSLALSGSSTLYAGGSFSSAGPVTSVGGIAEWNGSIWLGMGPSGNYGMNGFVYALAVSGNTLYAGGLFSTAGGNPAFGIAAWNGSWSQVGSGLSSTINALAVAPNGYVYAGGQFAVGNIFWLARWDGSIWSALGSSLNGPVYALATSKDGDLFAGGSFTGAGTNVSAYAAEAILVTHAPGLSLGLVGFPFSQELWTDTGIYTEEWSEDMIHWHVSSSPVTTLGPQNSALYPSVEYPSLFRRLVDP